MVLSTAKAIEVLYENAIDQYQQRTHMLNLTMHFTPDPGDYQNSNNIIWRPLEQHAPIKEGWDMTGNFGDVIEQYYPATLETPKNDAWQLRADDMRDMRFWERRGRASGRRQATFLNRRIAQLIVQTGTLFYRLSGTQGFNFVSEAGSIMDERQVSQEERYYVLNVRDNNTYSADLANRGTLADRPESAYAMGYIGRNVAGFDMYTGSYIPNLTGSATALTNTVSGNQTFAPQGSTGTGQNVQNVDYRQAVIPVSATTGISVNDVITFSNSGVPVRSLGLADKSPTGQTMTFRVVAVTAGTSITVWPKPIALNDTTNLDAEELAYANVDTAILDGATIARLNVDPTVKPNIYWAQDSIEVIGGQIPADMLQQFGGLNVMSETMENGQVMYLIYDGTIEDLNFKARLFTWWGLVNVRPDANGIGIRVAA